MPKYNSAYDIEEAFKAIEDDLMKSMIRNLDKHRAEELKEGYNWAQWQVVQLQALEQYRKDNIKKFSGRFSNINKSIDNIIKMQRQAGASTQEIAILNAIKKGFKANKHSELSGQFLNFNDRKIDALIKATKSDFIKDEHAMLRKADDMYRQVIYRSQVYAATGTGSYKLHRV